MSSASEIHSSAAGTVLVIGATCLLGRQIVASLRLGGHRTVGAAQHRVEATDLALDMARPGADEVARPRDCHLDTASLSDLGIGAETSLDH